MSLMETAFISLLLTPIILYALLLLGLGVSILRSKRWDIAFQRTAASELNRRGLWHDVLTTSEIASANSIYGAKNLVDGNDEIDVDHFVVLDAASEYDESAEELVKLRSVLLVRALRRQRAVAGRIQRLNNLPRVWWVTRVMSEAEVAVRGVHWVLVRHTPMMKRLFAGPAAYSVVAGVVISAGYWLVQSANGTATELAVVVGTVMSWTSVVAVWSMVASTIAEIGNALHGGRRQWGCAQIACTAAAVAVVFGVVTLYATGVFGWLAQAQVRVSESIPATGGIPVRIFSILFGGFMLWVAWNLVCNARFRRLRLSNRIQSAAAALLMLLLAIVSVHISLADVGIPGIKKFVSTSGLVIMALVLIGRLTAAVEWLSRRRLLLRAGIVIPSRGFSVRCGIGIVTTNVVACLSVVKLDQVTYASVQSVQMAAFAIAIVTMLGLFVSVAWCVAGWLYVRRVDKYYEQYRTEICSSYSVSGAT
ncbi:hypothetical protein [Rhodococcus sp. EPR-157]|uniref:hypothetical protein n=1 Tax=Rhodococcus sp. EPR-157 TaxID=1813677 RepID=UPI0012E93433|nr:hypothetical protein [Rhodococcus sp. EPR-157]